MFPNRSPYRISLFDDIHTYLPELLYNRGRFRNVQDVLDYVHDVASHQLNPWPAAVADYTARVTADINPMFATAATTPIYRRTSGPNRRYPGTGATSNYRYNARTGATIPHQPPQQQHQTRIHSRLHRTLPVYQNANYLNYYGYGDTAAAAAPTTETQDLLNLINAAFGIMPTTATQPAAPRPVASWLDPVVISPSNEEINAGSHTFMIADVSTETSDCCAICQEDFISGAAVRRLNVCRHLFHRHCIDRWFNSNVRCPVCRYDIRVPAAAPPQQETVSSYIQEATTPAEAPTPTPTATALSSDSPISDSTMSAAVEALMNLITGTGATNAGDNITIRIEVDDDNDAEETP